ncbi:LysR family transcriptional regulator [Azospirillum picis]|uniref:DNA-binding transcriptional LysR family regulator n=1 Tax=Azospirillum picis TaxID=488438 RepID=A0ABU0MDX8_9PROT|nr:LysR family transcriptional regulator [Azospirillum picis]MBP2297336.1 DNA-binding transcriptional LysR family regulator [Azospirillum picis]MDQ0531641.1 DNA-binding transcriptional LysR family regulator [Azospirillum picis]
MRGNEYADLRAFVTIVEQGSFTRAAKHLRVAPSTLSQTIRELEERLGVRLLNRTTRSISLTDAGAHLLARFKPAMEEMEAAVVAVRSFRDTPAGTVRLHLPRLASATFLEPVLGLFREAYPDIVLDMTIDDAVIDIVKSGFDAGIRLGEFLESNMVAITLGGSVRQVAVASPDYLAQHGRPTTPSDLLKHRCINWRQPGTNGFYNWEFEKDGQDVAVAVDGPLVVSHRDVAITAAVQGVGIAFWEEEQVRPLIEVGKLVPVLEDWSPRFPGWHLCYPRQRYTPATVRALADFLRSSRGQQSPSDAH